MIASEKLLEQTAFLSASLHDTDDRANPKGNSSSFAGSQHDIDCGYITSPAVVSFWIWRNI